jgi:hypothetical protein
MAPKRKKHKGLVATVTAPMSSTVKLTATARIHSIEQAESADSTPGLRPKYSRDRETATRPEAALPAELDEPQYFEAEHDYPDEDAQGFSLDLPAFPPTNDYARRLQDELTEWNRRLPLCYGVWATVRSASFNYSTLPPALPPFMVCRRAPNSAQCPQPTRVFTLVNIDGKSSSLLVIGL